MFQQLAVFPRLSVAANVCYGLRQLAAAKRRTIVADLLARFDIAGLADRLPHELSGGEQQRMALARALAPRPRLLLLDEPLAAPDVTLRGGMRRQLRDWLTASGTPVVLVTHDPADAAALADDVVTLPDPRHDPIC